MMANQSHSNIIVYTTPTSPDCHMLKEWLTQNAFPFEERDLTDPKIMMEAKENTGVRVAPITLIGEQIFYGTFASQKPKLMVALGLKPR